MENDSFTIHNPMYVTDEPRMQVLLAALGPVMLKLAGSRTDGTILWLADEKAIESHIAPRLNAAATEAGRPAPRIVAGVPICLCRPDEVDAAKARADRVLSEATVSPNYQRLLDQGNATGVSDILAAGDEDDDPGAPRLVRRRPASPTSRCASCRSAKAATNSSSRAAAPANSSPRSPPPADLLRSRSESGRKSDQI